MIELTADPLALLTGAFAGACILVLLLSLLVAFAYREPMLAWHAATLASALLPLMLKLSAWQTGLVWGLQVALAAQTFRTIASTTGAMRRPALALRAVSFAIALLAVVVPVGEQWVYLGLLTLWVGVMVWCQLRLLAQTGRWAYWLAIGQVVLACYWGIGWLAPLGTGEPAAVVLRFAVLAVFAVASYLAMVWLSRSRTENALRVEAREKTDPLTGLAMPRVFLDRVDGAIVRSRSLNYTCALVMIRIDNLDKVVQEQNLDNNEVVILAASRAIAGALRPQDTAARLAGNRFGVLAEGVAEGDTLAMATKILAQGLRASQWGLPGSELQLQIAIAEVSKEQGAPSRWMKQLDELLRNMAADGGPSRIRTLARH